MYIRTAEVEVSGREHGEFLKLPLTNSDHLVSSGVWAVALDRASAGCKQRGYVPHSDLTVRFRDWYFSRAYRGRLDLDRLVEVLGDLCQIGYQTATLGSANQQPVRRLSFGRYTRPAPRPGQLLLFESNPEPPLASVRPQLGRRLTFGPQRRLVLFEENSETILSTTSSSCEDLGLIARGKFAHPAITWQMTVINFLRFLRAVETCLNQPGKTSQARLNLDVLGDGFLIRVRRLYHQRMDSVMRESLSVLGAFGGRIARTDSKRLANYAKLWFGDQAVLKQMMCYQDALVRSG